MADRPTDGQAQAEAKMASDKASEKASKGAEAANETIAQFRGAAQQQGLSALKAAQDRYEAAKDLTAKKTGEATDSATAAKDQTVEYAAQTKDSYAVS